MLLDTSFCLLVILLPLPDEKAFFSSSSPRPCPRERPPPSNLGKRKHSNKSKLRHARAQHGLILNFDFISGRPIAPSTPLHLSQVCTALHAHMYVLGATVAAGAKYPEIKKTLRQCSIGAALSLLSHGLLPGNQLEKAFRSTVLKNWKGGGGPTMPLVQMFARLLFSPPLLIHRGALTAHSPTREQQRARAVSPPYNGRRGRAVLGGMNFLCGGLPRKNLAAYSKAGPSPDNNACSVHIDWDEKINLPVSYKRFFVTTI